MACRNPGVSVSQKNKKVKKRWPPGSKKRKNHNFFPACPQDRFPPNPSNHHPLSPEPELTMLASPVLLVVVAFGAIIRIATADSCPAGPFQLHNFTCPDVDKEPARPYFIVVCDLSTTVRLDPLMHPDNLTCRESRALDGTKKGSSSASASDLARGARLTHHWTCPHHDRSHDSRVPSLNASLLLFSSLLASLSLFFLTPFYSLFLLFSLWQTATCTRCSAATASARL